MYNHSRLSDVLQIWLRSSVGLEHLTFNEGVPGSNPGGVTTLLNSLIHG